MTWMVIQVALAADGANAHRAGLKAIEQLTYTGRIHQGLAMEVGSGRNSGNEQVSSQSYIEQLKRKQKL